MFTVKKYNATDAHNWNSFLASSNIDTFLFHRNFMDYHKHRFTDASVLVYKHKKLIALFPANSSNGKVFSHKGLSYGGLIYTATIKTSEFLAIYSAILQYYNRNEHSHVVVKALPNIYKHNACNNPLPYVCFKLQAKIAEINLRSVLKTSTFKLSNSRKEGLKRAQKHKLTVEETSNFSTFWNSILIPNLQQKHKVTPVHSSAEMTRLKEKFPSKIRQFNVCYNAQVVAGATVFEMENTANIQYISGNHLNNTLGSIDVLHHHLITQVFQHKQFIDFGTSNINQGKNINQGLLFWKEGFTARSIPQTTYSIATKNYTLLNQTFI